MKYKIVINKGIRDGSWIGDPNAELTLQAQDLMGAILEAAGDDGWDISTSDLAQVMERRGVTEFTETVADSFRELLDVGCIRVARVSPSGRRAA